MSKITNNPFIVFISLLDVLVSLITALYSFVKNKETNFNDLNNILNMNYFEISIRIIATIFLFILWRNFLKTKNDIQDNMNKINEHWFNQLEKSTKEITNNINNSNRINHNKIRFIYFHNEYKNADNDEYFAALKSNGFSREDLLEIGINETIINENKDKIFSKNVMEKFLEFKNELKNEHSRNI